MQLSHIKFTQGCCGTPPHDYAEVSLADGGILRIVCDGGSEPFTVARFGHAEFSDKQMTYEELDSLIKSDAGGIQIYV